MSEHVVEYGTGDIVDQHARDLALRAIAMITTHERVCEERAAAARTWRETVTTKLDKIGENVTGLYDSRWAIACATIVLLLAVLGYLLAKHGI